MHLQTRWELCTNLELFFILPCTEQRPEQIDLDAFWCSLSFMQDILSRRTTLLLYPYCSLIRCRAACNCKFQSHIKVILSELKGPEKTRFSREQFCVYCQMWSCHSHSQKNSYGQIFFKDNQLLTWVSQKQRDLFVELFTKNLVCT